MMLIAPFGRQMVVVVALLAAQSSARLAPNNKLDSEQANALDKTRGYANSLEQLEEQLEANCGKVPKYEQTIEMGSNTSDITALQGREPRVVGGTDAVPGEWPFIVRLTVCDTTPCGPKCTGSVINERWMITAAHCLDDNALMRNLTATFGLYDLKSPDKGSFSVQIDKAITHCDYDGQPWAADLALLRFKEPISFGENVQPVCLVNALANVEDFTRGKHCYSIGYGRVAGGEPARRLQKLNIDVKPRKDCSKAADEGFVCIDAKDKSLGARGLCTGDSGGPSVCHDPKSNRWHVFGVASHINGSCRGKTSWESVLINLGHFRKWILRQMLQS